MSMFRTNIISGALTVVLVCWMVCPWAVAQDDLTQQPAPAPLNVGEAEIAFQGYYLGGSGQSLVDASGTALRLRQFVDGVGLLSVNFEGYGSQGNLRLGENYIDLQKVSLFGQHWRVTGGDFHLSSNLVANPFSNIYNPDIKARGVRMEMSRDDRSIAVFFGPETLQDGPRISFLERVPQKVIGASVQQTVGENFHLALRYLHFDSSQTEIANNPIYFPLGRQFLSADSIALQSTYKFSEHFKLYGETAASKGEQASGLGAVDGGHLSVLAGPVWETEKFTVRGNYVSQPASYLPVLGYFAGDRRGVYADGRYRLSKRIEFSATVNHYANNLAKDPTLPQFRDTGYSLGGSFVLPWKFTASGNLSTINFSSFTPNTALLQNSKNRQLIVSANRPVGHHNLRFTYMNLNLNSNSSPQTQRSAEAEDTFLWKRFSFGGAIRSQNSVASESRNTLFFRGSSQVNLRRFSLYAYIEKGHDLMNSTIFSTNSYSSSVVGASAPLYHGWTLQLEAFRNNLNTILNPQNVFVMQSQGIGVTNTLSAFNQWSSYFKLAKRFQWGGEFPAEGIEQYSAVHNPIVGTVEGIILEASLEGRHVAVGVPVSLDGSRVVSTDAMGHYRFADVPVGSHEISVARQELPAEFEPGDTTEAKIMVQPRAIARADLQVVRLTSMRGRVIGPKGLPIGDIVIRLAPTTRYTTPDTDGSFAFYNLREGDYELTVDPASLPEGFEMASAERIPISVRLDATAATADFEIRARIVAKPVRVLLDQTIEVHDKGNKATSSGHRSGKSQKNRR